MTKQNRPVFLCGPSRSGTNLLSSVVEKHPDLHIVAETHYYDDLRMHMKGREQSGLSEEDHKTCQDYFLALAHRPFGHAGDPEQSWMKRADLAERAKSLGDGADSYFEAYCQLDLEKNGKVQWGERTPRHIFRIDDILNLYPDAIIIGIVRDPRAVSLSYRDWKNQGGFDLESDPEHANKLKEEELRTRKSYHIIIQSLLWNGAVNALIKAQKTHGKDKVFIQNYEDLVLKPEESVKALCTFMGRPFHEDMLNVPIVNSSFTTFSTKGGFNTQAINRWKEKLSLGEIATIQKCCKGAMEYAGYSFEKAGIKQLSFFYYLATLPYSLIRAILANRERMGESIPLYIWRRLKVAFKS